MKTILTAAILLILSAAAYAACTTSIVNIGTQTITCTTCCFDSGNCVTNCF